MFAAKFRKGPFLGSVAHILVLRDLGRLGEQRGSQEEMGMSNVGDRNK